jgi:hypothetical protein
MFDPDSQTIHMENMQYWISYNPHLCLIELSTIFHFHDKQLKCPRILVLLTLELMSPEQL